MRRRIQAMVQMPQTLLLSPQVRDLYKSSIILSPAGRAEKNPSCKSLPPLGSQGLNLGKADFGLGLGSLSLDPVSTEHRVQGRASGLGYQLRPPLPPLPDPQGQAHSAPCCLRVQTHFNWEGHPGAEQRGTLWTSACLAHHAPPHRGRGFSSPRGSSLCWRCHHPSVLDSETWPPQQESPCAPPKT